MNKIPFSVYDFFGYLSTGFLILFVYDYAFHAIRVAVQELSAVQWIFWLIVSYIIGHLVAHLSSVVLELFFLRRVLHSPEEHLFSSGSHSFWTKIFPGNFKPFPQETQDRILARARQNTAPLSPRALFFHCHPIVKRDQATLERLNSFLNLYGFCRNMSMSLLIIAIFLLIGSVEYIGLGTPYIEVSLEKLLWSFTALVGSVGMFLRYLKFFRHYTLEVFMTYAELS